MTLSAMLRAMQTMTTTWARAFALVGALLFAACAPRNSSTRSPASRTATPQPPAARSMEQTLAMGLWNSNFGAVKLERDSSAGEDAVIGLWLYERNGEDIIGYFSGSMRGNVLEFGWHEPAQPNDLVGRGFIAIDAEGTSFTGRWWTNDQQRSGVFRGWRDRVLLPQDGAPVKPESTDDQDAPPAAPSEG